MDFGFREQFLQFVRQTCAGQTELLRKSFRFGKPQRLLESLAHGTSKLRDAIAATKEYPSATGPITMNAAREVYKPVQIQIIKDGEFRRYAVIDDPVLLAPPTN